MSQNVDFNGETHTLPTQGERGWAAAVTAFLVEVAENAISMGMALAAEWDLGATYGIRAKWFRSQTTNPATIGAVRLARADVVAFRNQANGADLSLGVDTSNNLEWEGSDVVTKATEVGPSFLTLGFASSASDTTSRYSMPGGPTSAADTTERFIPVPAAMTVRNIFVCATVAPAATCTFVVRKNGVDTALTCTVANGATAGNGSASVSFAAGDRLSVKHTMASASTAPTAATVCIKAYL